MIIRIGNALDLLPLHSAHSSPAEQEAFDVITLNIIIFIIDVVFHFHFLFFIFYFLFFIFHFLFFMFIFVFQFCLSFLFFILIFYFHFILYLYSTYLEHPKEICSLLTHREWNTPFYDLYRSNIFTFLLVFL